MKIGFDAKWYFRGPPSGRRVVRNIVKQLFAVAGDDEIHVFTDRDFRNRELDVVVPPGQRHHVWAGNNQLSNLGVLPRLADRLGLDAVVYQNFVPPRARGHARIALVYDAIFETHPAYFTALERLYLGSLRYLVRTADRVCTGSHAERARLIALGYASADRIDVVPNAVDDVFLAGAAPDDERAGMLAGLGIPRRYILFAGRVTARKNVGTLVRALALLEEPIALVIAGATDDTAGDFAAAVRDSRLGERVHVVGPVDDEVLRALYASAAVFCFPSFDEGFGLPPLEAMALGTPCVVSDIPPLREVCGDAALYADPHSAASIAASLTRLLREPALAAELRSAGVVRASAFRWDASAAALLRCVRAADRLVA